MLEFAHALPALREHVDADLARDDLSREHVLASRPGCWTAASSGSDPRTTR